MEKMNLNTEFLNQKAVEPVKSVKSELVIAKEQLTKTVEGNVRSLSSYFKEYRKDVKNVQKFLEEAQARGRRFNGSMVHDIINVGNLEPIKAADDSIQATKKQAAKIWSAARLHAAFVKAVELPKQKTPK